MSRKARRIIQRGKLNNIVSIRDVEVGPILDLPDLLGKGLSADIKELTVPLINVTNVDLTLDEGRLGISAEGVNIKATVRVALKHLGSGITIEPLIVVTARGNAQGSLLTASTPSPPTTPHPQVQTHNLSLHLTHFDFSLPNLSTIPRFMFDAIEFLVRASIRRQIEWAVSTKISDFLTSYLNKTFEKEVAVNGVADTRNQYVSMGFDVGYNVKMQFVGPLRFTKEGIVTGVRTKPTVKAVPA
ncbi:hypothetical protein HK102_000595 [Quaeritorhiza haematococci]|nr:hypothetical protein HK102_000595 [Quaeritorhiza haematococci]